MPAACAAWTKASARTWRSGSSASGNAPSALRANDGLDVVPRPPGAAGSCPRVVVGTLPSQDHHRVHRRRPAEHAPAREHDLAAVELGLRRRRVAPVDVGAIEAREGSRDLGLELPGARAGLEQQHREVGVLGETRREDATRRPAADDDDVVHAPRIGRDDLGTKPCPTRDRFAAYARRDGDGDREERSEDADGRDSVGRRGAPRGGDDAAARRRQAVLRRRAASRGAGRRAPHPLRVHDRRDPRAAVPSRCGRATSSDCGRRSSARPSSRRRLVSSAAPREPTASARQAGASARCAAAASTSAASRSPPSADPSSGSTACSGWGMSPMTLPASLTTPATLPERAVHVLGVAQHDLPAGRELDERPLVRVPGALAVLDGDHELLPELAAAHEDAVDALDVERRVSTDELELPVRTQDAGQQARLAQDLEPVADARAQGRRSLRRRGRRP